MAFLQADSVREEHGLCIKEKIIPWGSVWPKNVYDANGRIQYAKGSLYKADRLLSGGSGKVQYITIHNTNTIVTAQGTTMAEQYARATWPNANMKDSRVHYYIDDKDCWQLLREDEVGWHASDSRGPGNESSLAIEIIMDGSGSESDKKAEERGALLAAILLVRHDLSIEKLATHNMWYNKKYCPKYILPHWEAFRQSVAQNMNAIQENPKEMENPAEPSGKEDPLTAAIHVDDLVRLKENTVYYDGTAIPDWVRARAWYVKSISGSRAVIDRDEQNTHAICSPVDITYLSLVQSKDSEKNQQFPYLVKVTASVLNIRSGPGTDQAKTGKITDYGVYTIEEEADGPGAEKWGKLKSGAGWIALDYTKKV